MLHTQTTEQEILTRLHSVNSQIRCAFGSMKSTIDTLTVLHFRVLIAIAHREIETVTDVAKIFSITKASASVLIDRLVKTGWIERKIDITDHRRQFLSLSDTGKKNLQKRMEKKMKAAHELFKTLSTKDKKELIRLLKKLDSHLTA